MKRQRIEKHESLIHGVVNEYILKEGKSFLKNEFVTVMGIKLSPDLSVALIFISVLDNSKSDFVNERFQERKHDIKQYIVKAIAKKIRKIHFGDKNYPQYKDRTPLKLYAHKNHNTRKRMQNYFSRHSGTRKRGQAIKMEKKKAKGYYNAKILSHLYLW